VLHIPEEYPCHEWVADMLPTLVLPNEKFKDTLPVLVVFGGIAATAQDLHLTWPVTSVREFSERRRFSAYRNQLLTSSTETSKNDFVALYDAPSGKTSMAPFDEEHLNSSPPSTSTGVMLEYEKRSMMEIKMTEGFSYPT